MSIFPTLKFQKALGLLVWLAAVVFSPAMAQPLEQAIKIIVSPDRADWMYKPGEKVSFSVTVLKNSNPVKNAIISYQIGPEKMQPGKSATLSLGEGNISLDGGTMTVPGFLRCTVTTTMDGKVYRGLATAGFSPELIKPTAEKPADFNSFWSNNLLELSKIPLDTRITLLPEKGSALTDVYQVNIQNIGNSRLFGILCLPKKPGSYPALLQVPGAGIRPYGPDLEMADKGMIVLTIGIHGIPVTMETSVHNQLESGALKGYFFFNMNNRDRYYYRRVYLGCVRANDLIFSLPQFDGHHLAVSGNSQGGALSIITAALDSRVNYLAAIHPALCDLTGYFNGRAGGWPHMFNEVNISQNNSKDIREALSYYDVDHFAAQLKTEGFYTWGFNDETCPPTSMFAAYNAITAKKELVPYLETGHWVYPEQKAKFNNWLISRLLPGK